MGVERFDVFLVNLDPAVDHEIKKSCPCLVISPDEMNKYMNDRFGETFPGSRKITCFS
jgi:mRNA interferase MazF